MSARDYESQDTQVDQCIDLNIVSQFSQPLTQNCMFIKCFTVEKEIKKDFA